MPRPLRLRVDVERGRQRPETAANMQQPVIAQVIVVVRHEDREQDATKQLRKLCLGACPMRPQRIGNVGVEAPGSRTPSMPTARPFGGDPGPTNPVCRRRSAVEARLCCCPPSRRRKTAPWTTASPGRAQTPPGRPTKRRCSETCWSAGDRRSRTPTRRSARGFGRSPRSPAMWFWPCVPA